MEPYFVYILQSRVNDSFYKGSTNDLVRRFLEHNSGKDKSTARYAPWDLVWFGTKTTRAKAATLERKLKNLSISRTIDFIHKYPVTYVIDGLVICDVRVQS